ncbi:ATP synthase [Helicosporidium sp. ATCC 50920]|nr:ATP synthase [Helicosporidium sp. ATCC 50920]|eukprot:KDD73033.1 ATP synthase [Helicosporidium sp. ATCC 50920]
MARSFASEAALPPQFTVEGRYAAALYAAAGKAKVLDKVEAELSSVREALRASAQFRTFVMDPTASAKDKQAVMKAVLDGLKVTDVTRRFMGLLSDNRRLTALDDIASTFASLAAQQRGDVTATLTTAAPWSKSDIKDLETQLSKLVGAGRNITLAQKTRPEILGGVVLDLDDKHIDLSIATRVRHVQDMIKTTSL